MKKTGNERPEWLTELLDIITRPEYHCAYYLVWSNYDSRNNYYAPYAASRSEAGALHGHELMDPFIRFYNNEKSIFAVDQKNTLTGSTAPKAPKLAGWGNTGYFTAPNGGTRILDAVTISARVSRGVTRPVIAVSNGTVEIKLDTKAAGQSVSAQLTEDVLTQLGETANGKITLLSGTEQLAELTVLFNIPEKEPDPYMVDDFESYYGVDSMLTASWAMNKGSGNDLTVALDQETAQDGYAMKFTYTETAGGYAGATITKDVDWSDCNALRFWTIPDGKQQKVVIQIQANDTCYETYLNLYDAYNARAGKPTLVTIPFTEFGQRDTAGNPKGGLTADCAKVSSFGLWVNAVENQFFQNNGVTGTLWYDNITAIKTDTQSVSFEDVSNTAQTKGGSVVSGWALEQVNAAEDNTLVPDILAGKDLTKGITRAEFAAVAVRLYETMSSQTVEVGENPFTDTTEPDGLKAYKMDIVHGIGNGKFAPDDLVTREQAAMMLTSVYVKLNGQIPAAGVISFADDTDVSDWAWNAVAFTSDKGIITGVGENRFEPQGSTTREQALIMALDMFQVFR